jgi:F0F1-type ATP synthase assembly protein I
MPAGQRPRDGAETPEEWRAGRHEDAQLRDILAILLLQCGVGTLGAIVAFAVSGTAAAGAALIGTAICVVPSAFLAARLLMSQAPEQLMRALWLGEIGKLALTVVLFAVVLTTVSVAQERPFWVLIGFITAQLGTFGSFLLPSGNREN